MTENQRIARALGGAFTNTICQTVVNLTDDDMFAVAEDIDFSAPEWQEKIKVKVRGLWCEWGSWVTVHFKIDTVAIRLWGMQTEGDGGKVFIHDKVAFEKRAKSEAECWNAALLWLAEQKEQS